MYVQAKYPLIKACDMPADLKDEVLDICLSAAEKFPQDYEKCTQESLGVYTLLSVSPATIVAEHIALQTIKEFLDKRTGGPWHVIAGMNFTFDVTHKVSIEA